MANNTNTSRKLPGGCVVLIVIAIILPFIAGWAFSGSMIDANRAGCAMLQSGLQQVNPLPQKNPTTAADCLKAVDAQAFFFRIVGIGMAYILAVGAVMTLVVISTIFGRKTPPTSTANH